jgi:5-methylcytosine-specific restriction endonuclease McrA
VVHKDPIIRAEFMKRYHRENDNRITRKRKLKHRIMLERIKVELGCEHCGYNEEAVALQFHHINPKNKEFTIASKTQGPLLRLLKETEKCMILCSNCHAIEERRLNENALY